jgi:hypothetical protein
MSGEQLSDNTRETLELLALYLDHVESQRSPEDIASLVCELRYDFGLVLGQEYEGSDLYVVSAFQERLESLEQKYVAQTDAETLTFHFGNEFEKDPQKALHLFDILFRHPQNVIARIQLLQQFEKGNDVSVPPLNTRHFLLLLRILAVMHHSFKGDENFFSRLPNQQLFVHIATLALSSSKALEELFEIRRMADTIVAAAEQEEDRSEDTSD